MSETPLLREQHAARIANLAKQGFKFPQIAEQLGLSVSWTKEIAQKYGIRSPHVLERQWCPKLWGPRDAYIKEHWGVMTASAMGRNLGCRPDDVRARAKIMGLDWALLRQAAKKAKENNLVRPTPKPKSDDDPLVTEPVVKSIVKAKDGAADVMVVLAKQPALVGVWR
ncbi:MAG: hypothetical protein ACRC1H_09240 [Caldilineaceae bacterium]